MSIERGQFRVSKSIAPFAPITVFWHPNDEKSPKSLAVLLEIRPLAAALNSCLAWRPTDTVCCLNLMWTA